MTHISHFMGDDHARCDELFGQAEIAVSQRDWGIADLRFASFREALERHLVLEESVLFPAFEERTGMHGGPTAVMRLEHAQMRDLVEAMARALEYRQQEEYLGQADTLATLMQQHNMKEENILYPMADKVLADDAVAVLDDMRNHSPAGA